MDRLRSALAGLLTALSLYSVIPAPRVAWEERNMRSALCFFPLVGVLAGGLLLLWGRLALRAGLEPLLFAAVAALLPVGVSGGIHMDGLMDVCDALASHAPPARRLEIMKDPHSGAFAVLGCGAYLLLVLGLWAQLFATSRTELVAVAAAGTVVSRALDALSILLIPPAKNAGLAHLFAGAAARGPAIACNLIFALTGCGVAIWAHPLAGLLATGLCGIYFLLHRRLCVRSFGGNTGDLAGFLLQMTELLFLAAAVMGGLWG